MITKYIGPPRGYPQPVPQPIGHQVPAPVPDTDGVFTPQPERPLPPRSDELRAELAALRAAPQAPLFARLIAERERELARREALVARASEHQVYNLVHDITVALKAAAIDGIDIKGAVTDFLKVLRG